MRDLQQRCRPGRGAESSIEVTLRPHQQPDLPVLLHLVAGSDLQNDHRQYRVAITNIRQQKLVEQALAETLRQKEEALAQLDALFSAAPISLGFLDHDLRFVRLNQTLADINGLPIEAHLASALRKSSPDLEQIDSVVATGSGSWRPPSGCSMWSSPARRGPIRARNVTGWKTGFPSKWATRSQALVRP